MNTTFKEKVGYGLGDMASSMFWKLFSMYLLFFYTDIFGISAAAVGTMFLVTRIWDALNDPLMGIIADRTNTRWGKFRPYLLWMAIPFGVVGVLTFTTPSSLSEGGKVIYAYVTYTLMMMVYTAINAPYGSLLGVMTADPKGRTSLSSYRMFFAYVGSIISLMLIEPLVQFFSQTADGIDLARGWQLGVAVIAVICAILFWGCFAWTTERIKPIATKNAPVKDDLTDLFRNRPWWILLGAGVATLIFNSIRDGATMYYFKYYVTFAADSFWGQNTFSLSLSSLYLIVGQAGNIIGVLLAAPVANKIGKKRTFISSMILACCLSVIFYFLPSDSIPEMFMLQALISICAGSIFPLLWAMYADVVDYSEWKQGRRATGLIFASSTMSQKLGWTLGGALTGWLLAHFGFEANTAQSNEVLFGIKSMMSLLPAAGTVMSIIFISLYPLSESKMKAIISDLNSKRNDKTVL